MSPTKRHYSAKCLAGLLLLAGQLHAAPVGTLITYQGHLTSNGVPADGSYDLRFSLHDAATEGSLIAGPLTNSAVAVSNGLFTVGLDFGTGPSMDRRGGWKSRCVRCR